VANIRYLKYDGTLHWGFIELFGRVGLSYLERDEALARRARS
jgi:hypothetical protein